MIDFQTERAAIEHLIVDSLQSFADEEHDVRWSAFALYACPWAGWIVTSFDTEAHSAAHVAEWSKNGPDWYGEDEWGRFGDNCPDFQYPEWRLLSLDAWQEEFDSGDVIHIRDLQRQDHFIGHDNEDTNGLVFSFLQAVLWDLTNRPSAKLFPTDGIRRIGVQLLDSRHVAFSRLKSREA